MSFFDELFDSEEERNEFLKNQEKYDLERERKSQIDNNKISLLFRSKTSSQLNDYLNQMDTEDLKFFYYELNRAISDIKYLYHNKMNDEVFSISNLTLKELVIRHSWDEVKDSLFSLYPDQINLEDGYEKVYHELNQLTPSQNEDNSIIILEEGEEEYNEGAVEACSIKPKDMTTYALDFLPWEEWLGYYCNQLDLEKHGETAFIAHCLWEMTFDGFSQEQVKERLDELKERIDEVNEDYTPNENENEKDEE